jgi:hypothetical protein
MRLICNGIDLGMVTSVGALTVTPVVDEETGELLYRRVRVDVTLAVDGPGLGEAGDA